MRQQLALTKASKPKFGIYHHQNGRRRINKRALQLVEMLQLQPHPEGGFFREVYRSAQSVYSSQVSSQRSALTDIYFLLAEDQISRFHRVTHDEVWHFYEGAPLKLFDVTPNGNRLEEHLLGNVGSLPYYTHTIKANHWQAAISAGEYSLVGCTVAPGFDFEDFSFLSDSPELLEQFTAKLPQIKRYV